jgi:16S rRNA (uracil1498-N3)-methyltransferase
LAVKSIYLPNPPIDGDRLRVTGDEHHHLAVARVEEGEAVELFDGRGRVWSTEVLSSSKRETVLRIVELRHDERRAPELMIGISLIKTTAFELALEKAVEVGVTRIIPVIASRSNVSPPRRLDRWQRIVVEAAKQSKRYWLPLIDEPIRFDEVLQFPASTKIVFAEHNGGPLKSALAGSPALFLIGPEGGWTDEELEAATKSGFQLVSLGEAILRTETAAIIGAALIRYELEQTL